MRTIVRTFYTDFLQNQVHTIVRMENGVFFDQKIEGIANESR